MKIYLIYKIISNTRHAFNSTNSGFICVSSFRNNRKHYIELVGSIRKLLIIAKKGGYVNNFVRINHFLHVYQEITSESSRLLLLYFYSVVKLLVVICPLQFVCHNYDNRFPQEGAQFFPQAWRFYEAQSEN